MHTKSRKRDPKVYRTTPVYMPQFTTPIREHKSEQRTCREFVTEAEKKFPS